MPSDVSLNTSKCSKFNTVTDADYTDLQTSTKKVYQGIVFFILKRTSRGTTLIQIILKLTTWLFVKIKTEHNLVLMTKNRKLFQSGWNVCRNLLYSMNQHESWSLLQVATNKNIPAHSPPYTHYLHRHIHKQNEDISSLIMNMV